MTTPLAEERIKALSGHDAKAALLLLAYRLPYETEQAVKSVTGKRT